MTKKKKPAKKQAIKAKSQKAKAPPPSKPNKPLAIKVDAAAKSQTGATSASTRPAAASASAPRPKEAATVPRSVAQARQAKNASAPAPDQRHTSSIRAEGAGASSLGNGKASLDVGVMPEAVLQAALPLQTFAIDMQRMAKQSIAQTADVLERLRDAKSVEEVVALQTTFMQQSFRNYTEFAGRISQLMTSSHASLFHQSQAAMRSFRSIATGM